MRAAVLQTDVKPPRRRHGPEEDPEEDDAATYSYNIGRWSREVDACLHTDEFWIVLEIAYITRGPLTHLENWLGGSNSKKTEKGESKQPAMLELVCERADQIDAEFQDLIDEDSRWDFLWDNDSYCRVGMGRQPEFVAVAVSCILECYSDFFNRILGPCRIFPRLILWLVHRPASESCENRRECAKDLLSSPAGQLDTTCVKLRILFKHELGCAAETGRLSRSLWTCITDVAGLWLVDAQDVEGCNNQIKTITKLAPHIKWPLLSSRITAKQRVEQARNVADREDLISTCVSFHQEALDMSKTEGDRWGYASIRDDDPETPPRSHTKSPSEDDLCAAKMLVAINRRLAEVDTSFVASGVELALGVSQTDSLDFWIPSLHFRNVQWFAQAHGGNAGVDELESVLLQRPYVVRPALRVLSEYHAVAVARGPAGDLSCCAASMEWSCGTIERAHIVDIIDLVTMHEVCCCHGRRGGRGRRGRGRGLGGGARDLDNEVETKRTYISKKHLSRNLGLVSKVII